MAVMILVFAAAFVVGIPVAFSLGVTGITGLLIISSAPNTAAIKMYTSLDSFALLAIPLYAVMGYIMEKSGALNRLTNFLKIILGPVKGGMAYLNVFASLMFAGISGTAVSDVSSLGYLEMKMMEDTGLPKDFSGALTAASAVAGPIIPPSLAMVVYALAIGGGISISGLFASGVLPGLLLGLALLMTSYFYIHRKGVFENIVVFPGLSVKEILKSTWSALPVLLLPLIVIGGILGGIFTVTEAASVGTIYSLIVGFFITRELKISDLPLILVRAASLTGSIAIIFGASSLISWILTIEQIPQMLAAFIMSVTDSPTVFLFMVVCLMLLVGCVMEPNAAIIMLAPILYPIAASLGINPFQFGLVFVMTVEIGLLTPPVGVLLFVTSGVGNLELSKLIKAIWPFFFAEVLVVILTVLIPQLTTFLPAVFS